MTVTEMVIATMELATATLAGTVLDALLDLVPMIVRTLATATTVLAIAMLATLVPTAVSVRALVSAQITDVASTSLVFVTPTSPATIALCVVAQMTAQVMVTATTLPASASLASLVRTVASKHAQQTAPIVVSV
jgi:hypothetical protein